MREYVEKRSEVDKQFGEDMNKQDVLMPFAILILKVRADSDLSQEDLAKRLNVTKQDIDDWEKCRKAPNVDLLPKLATISRHAITLTFEPDSNVIVG